MIEIACDGRTAAFSPKPDVCQPERPFFSAKTTQFWINIIDRRPIGGMQTRKRSPRVKTKTPRCEVHRHINVEEEKEQAQF